MSVVEVSPDAGAALVADGAFLLDVREADEWAAGHSSLAAWIPLGSLPERLDEVPTDRQIVCICRSGGRSLRAAEFLIAEGRNALNLTGGMQAWAATALAVVNDAGEPGQVI